MYANYAPHPYASYAPQGPPPLPGTVTAVRVLMFLGGCLGVLTAVAVAVLLGALMGMDPANVSNLSDAEQVAVDWMAAEGISMELAAVIVGVLVGIPAVTGLASLFLAAVAGRRSRLWLWSVVAFQLVLALGYVLNVLLLNVLAIVPFALCILKICLMCGSRSRAYYAAS